MAKQLLDKTMTSAAQVTSCCLGYPALGSSCSPNGDAPKPMLPLASLHRIASSAAQASIDAIRPETMLSPQSAVACTPKLSLPAAAVNFAMASLPVVEPTTPRNLESTENRKILVSFSENVEWLYFDPEQSTSQTSSDLFPVKFTSHAAREAPEFPQTPKARQTPPSFGEVSFGSQTEEWEQEKDLEGDSYED